MHAAEPKVVAVVHDPVAAFELGVLAEVFGLDRRPEGLPGWRFEVCTTRPGRVWTTSGFAIEVEHGLDAMTGADLVAVPCWPTDGTPVPERMRAGLRAAVDDGAQVLSVCSGAFALADAGLLDGRRATTHWRFAAELARRFPRVRVDPDVLYVEDGPVVTSAGTAAGIDACLHLVRAQHGAAVANALARRIVVAPHREGGQAQYAERAVQPRDAADDVRPAMEWAQQHLAEPLSLALLARRVSMSTRTFSRRFRAVTGTTPHRWILEQRLDRVEQLLERTDLGIDAIAHRCGLGTADNLRYHFASRRQSSPSAYRSAFRAPVAG